MLVPNLGNKTKFKWYCAEGSGNGGGDCIGWEKHTNGNLLVDQFVEESNLGICRGGLAGGVGFVLGIWVGWGMGGEKG